MSQFPEPYQEFNALEQTAYQLSACTDQLFQQIKQQQAITSVIDKIRSSNDLNIVLKTTATEIRQLLNVDRVGVFRFYLNSGFDEGEFVAEDIGEGISSTLAAKVHDHCFGSQFAAYYTEGRIQAVADIYDANLSDCHISILEQFQVRANLIVPVLKDGKLWGLLCIHQCHHPRRWQLPEIEFIRKIADYFAIALQQAEQLEQITGQATLIAKSKAQAKALRRQKALVKITSRIRHSLDWAIICQTATQEVRNILEADRVAVYRFNPDWSGNFLFESFGDRWEPLVGAIPNIEDTHLMETQGGRYRENQTFAVNDIYTVGHTNCHVELLEQFQAKAYMIAPIFEGEKLWGLLSAYQNDGARKWQTDEIELLAQIGEQLGIALRQSREQERTVNRQKSLVKIVSKIRRSFDFQDICQTATDEIRHIIEADRVAIYRFNQDWSGQFLFESYAEGWQPLVGGAIPNIEDTHLMETKGGRYVQNETLSVNNIYTVGHTDCHVELLEQFQAKAYAIAPIFEGERLWGLLAAYQNSEPRQWQADEIDLLAQIGEQLGIALQQAEYVSRIQAQSTELKQTLQNLQDFQLQLIQSEKMASLGQLVAGVAHEINNPINFIHGNVQHLKQYTEDLMNFLALHQEVYPDQNPKIVASTEELDIEFIKSDLPKIINSMNLGTNRIQTIVSSLRNFSRMDEAEFKAVDIHEGIESTLLILKYRLKDQSGQAAVHIMRDYGELPLIECYPSQLNQVFMNLIANAIDAFDHDKFKVNKDKSSQQNQIEIQSQVTENNWIKITIIDNGIGMSEAIVKNIFDPFFTTKDIGKGTGMGLPISHKIITEKHGGRLDCISQLGKGTKFMIYIPIKQ
ncbi:MAG: GAF domain-containing protein [Limnothrix sp. RL_2_0]|nr:GAF domain-containing protein [Limnothrix sp. RL_2_0]